MEEKEGDGADITCVRFAQSIKVDGFGATDGSVYISYRLYISGHIESLQNRAVAGTSRGAAGPPIFWLCGRSVRGL